MRDRNAGQRRRRDGARHAGHDVERRRRRAAARALPRRRGRTRTDRRPSAARRAGRGAPRESSARESPCCVSAWRPARLPTKKRCARRASAGSRSSTSASYSTRSARAQPRDRACASAGPGSPGPAPTSETCAGPHSHESSGPLSQGTRGSAIDQRGRRAEVLRHIECAQDVRGVDAGADTARSARAAAAACAASIGTPSRRHSTRCRARIVASTAPRSRGSTASSASRRAPSAPARRRLVEIASVTPSRRTTPLRKALALAGSSTALTKTRRGSAAAATCAIHLGRRRRDDEPDAVEIGRHEAALDDLDAGATARSASPMSGATTRTRAPAASSCRSLAAATRPPPTSSDGAAGQVQEQGSRQTNQP